MKTPDSKSVDLYLLSTFKINVKIAVFNILFALSKKNELQFEYSYVEENLSHCNISNILYY